MAHYQQQGSIPPKRHTQHRRPARGRQSGELYYEELMGEEGFSSDSSLLYHRNIPSTIADAREWPIGDLSTTPNHPLMPRHLRLHDLFERQGRQGDRRRHRTPPRARQRRRADLVCRGRRAKPVVPQRNR